MKKRIWIAGFCLALLLSGCGSKESGSYEDTGNYAAAEASADYKATSDFSSGYSNDYEYDDYAVEEAADMEAPEFEPAEYDDQAASGTSDQVTDEQVEEYGTKIIRNASISLEVDSLEAFADNLKKTVYDYDGYIESMDINAYDSDYSESRYGYFTVRVPSSRLDDFLNIVKNEGVVTAKSESAEDVTLQYVDVEARIATYEAERDSLMELLDKATTLKDILAIRDKIAEVNYELDSLNRQLKSMQNKVSFSTVTVNAMETRTIAGNRGEKTYWEKIGENFMSELEDGLEVAIDLLIFLITRLPLFIIIVIVVLIIVKIIKAIFGISGKDKEARKKARAEAKAAKAANSGRRKTAKPVQGAQSPAVTEPVNEAAKEEAAPAQSGGHYTSNVPPAANSDEDVKKED